ncbi:MAG: alpha/beta hydrolase [Methylophaga sp.]|nr:alpha/beta hydrolase [Methylophaga sp.]
MTTKVITIPGYHGSAPEHWQSWLEAEDPKVERITGINWEAPNIAEWSAVIGHRISTSNEQLVLVAHSFGCLATAKAIVEHPEHVAGVILVAPASPRRFCLSGAIADSATALHDISQLLPQSALPGFGLMIGSENDPWMDLATARYWARVWDLAFYNAGLAGHINVDSGHGAWPLIREFVDAMQEAVHPLPDEEVTHLGRWNRNRLNQQPQVATKQLCYG